LSAIPVALAQPFTSIQNGFTQSLFANTSSFTGGVAFAYNGDVLVDGCQYTGSPIYRFSLASTYSDGHGGIEHPQTAGSPFGSSAGCGLTNHPDGTLYTNTALGVINLDINTGAPLRAPFGAPGNALGITVDPQTNNIVYVGADCNFAATCTIVSINPFTLVSSNFAVLPPSETNFVDGISFDPTGRFLFLSNRSPVFRMTVLDRSGAVVQNVGMASEPDGLAFHKSPTFIVTNNIDGSMTRFDFPSNDFTLPPTQTAFAGGGVRGDLCQVSTDGCLYLTQDETRFNDGTTSLNGSVVKICSGFVPSPGVSPCAISSNFNGTNIAGGSSIWFNSVFSLPGFDPSQLTNPVTVLFSGAAITFTANGTPYTVNVPSATITYDPGVSTATSTFDAANNRWVTKLPTTHLPGTNFLSAAAFQVPAGGFPGGINPVIWNQNGSFSSSTPGLTVQWQWAAAVYTSFNTDYNQLNVKPVDDNQASQYKNSDHAGTPETYKSFVVGGARGGGGSNWTGSYSATGNCPVR
jgi:hypothetical protein